MKRKFSNCNTGCETISEKDSEIWLERKVSGAPYFMLKNLRENSWELN